MCRYISRKESSKDAVSFIYTDSTKAKIIKIIYMFLAYGLFLKQQRLIVLVRTGDKYTSKTAVTCCFCPVSSQMQVPNVRIKKTSA